MTGDFSASAIEDAVRADPAWSALLEEGAILGGGTLLSTGQP
jgi:hypothetical protein